MDPKDKRIGELEASLAAARSTMRFMLAQPIIRDLKTGALCAFRDRLPWAIEMSVREHVTPQGEPTPVSETRAGWHEQAVEQGRRADSLAAEKWQAVRERDAALKALRPNEAGAH